MENALAKADHRFTVCLSWLFVDAIYAEPAAWGLRCPSALRLPTKQFSQPWRNRL